MAEDSGILFSRDCAHFLVCSVLFQTRLAPRILGKGSVWWKRHVVSITLYRYIITS